MTEDQLEQETLGWLQDVGYTHLYGPDIAFDGSSPERANYRQVVLPFRLREAINRLNPDIPTATREDALKQVIDLGMPVLLSANQHFHRMLVTGVPVQYQLAGETRGDFVRLINWAQPDRNEWLAVTAGAKFAGHIAVYPGVCEIRYRADTGDKATAPIFMALGTKDDIINESTCKQYMAEVAANGNNVTVKSYQGAYHGWDTLNRFGYLQNSHGAYDCNMELQMTDKPGGGVGMNAKDIKNGKALASYDDWNAAVKGCMQHKPMSYGGDDKQRAALVNDVLEFIKK